LWLIKGQSTKLVLSQPDTMEARVLMVRGSNDEHGNIGETQCTCFGQN
jgi:hypothetical protein